MMTKAKARCAICEREFAYFKVTKPRRYCSGGCQYRGERSLANARRRAKAALKRIAKRDKLALRTAPAH